MNGIRLVDKVSTPRVAGLRMEVWFGELGDPAEAQVREGRHRVLKLVAAS